MKNRDKFIIGALAVIIWIGFWNWADSSLPEDSKVEELKSVAQTDTCASLITEKRGLENSASSMAREANELQRTLLRARLEEIAKGNFLSTRENNVLTEYLSYDLKKIVAEKSDTFVEQMERNIKLRPEAIKIVNKLIKNGVIEPYLFPEVQKIGLDLRVKYQEAKDLAKSNPNCFKSTLEIDKMIEDANSELGIKETYNGWITKKTSEELLDSLI